MLEAIFPKLAESDYEITSPQSDAYNCIAWAAGDERHWWWPVPAEETFWPSGVPREATLEAFVAAFATLGYEVCQDPAWEQGLEKVAFYTKDAAPKHAAKQRSDGRWTSKLGALEDVIHDSLESLAGDIYGQAMTFLRRPVTGIRQ
ncbi:MAG: hypothetical protein NTY19_50015 [Planctomycetota bacterium]|nr:hypothetical protein [Planctomycetota bacterium]